MNFEVIKSTSDTPQRPSAEETTTAIVTLITRLKDLKKGERASKPTSQYL